MFICCIDTETTGIPSRKGYDEYFHYSETSKYDSSRVIEIAYTISTSKGRVIKKVSHLIRPVGIKIENSNIHGITQEKAETEGIPMYDVLKELEEDIKNVSNLIGHNILFDCNVLLSEFHRLNFKDLILKFESVRKSCTMKLGRKLLGGGKPPKLTELYHQLFNEKVELSHRALADVETCFRCYIKLVDILGYNLDGSKIINEEQAVFV
jgi:DNA polymerase-3 subunit alpha